MGVLLGFVHTRRHVLDLTSYPESSLSNETVHVSVLLPDRTNGFYRSTRFDWSGMVASLNCRGQEFYGAWFDRVQDGLRDFANDGVTIVASPESAAVGPAEEFREPLAFVPAPGRTFVKLGVGVLQTRDDAPYSAVGRYDLVDPGRWRVSSDPQALTFTHELDDRQSGHAYVYRKTVRLAPAGAELIVDHELRNAGRLPLRTTQYTHNFLTFGGRPATSGLRVVLPFDARPITTPGPELVEISGRAMVFPRALVGRECVSVGIAGFRNDPSDHDIRIEHGEIGASVRVTGDRPLVRAWLWAIRSVVAFEPFVAVRAAPGETTRWTWRYRYTPGAP